MKKRMMILIMAAALAVCVFLAAAPLFSAGADTLEDTIEEAIRGHAANVDISRFGITVSEASDVFFRVFYRHPEFFYCSSRVRTSYIEGSNVAVSMELEYSMSASEAVTATNRYNAEIARITSLVPAGLSQAEKVLWLNDYIVSNYEYTSDDDPEIHDAYNFLMKKGGVCEAYSMTAMALLRAVGIESTYRGYGHYTEGSHAWLAVDVDGSLYNLDVTWNDPRISSRDGKGRTYGNMNTHRYMLVSDALMEKLGHRTGDNYGVEVPCTSELYDDAFWRDADDPMAYLNGMWYYISDGGVVGCRGDGSGRTEIPMDGVRWYVAGTSGSYWSGVYSGISTYGGRLFVNTDRGVSEVDTGSGKLTEIYRYGGEDQIFYSRMPAGSGRMTLYIDDEPNSSTYETMVIDITPLVPEAETPTPSEEPSWTPTGTPTAAPEQTWQPTDGNADTVDIAERVTPDHASEPSPETDGHSAKGRGAGIPAAVIAAFALALAAAGTALAIIINKNSKK